jgi:hypothetical protein
MYPHVVWHDVAWRGVAWDRFVLQYWSAMLCRAYETMMHTRSTVQLQVLQLEACLSTGTPATALRVRQLRAHVAGALVAVAVQQHADETACDYELMWRCWNEIRELVALPVTVLQVGCRLFGRAGCGCAIGI